MPPNQYFQETASNIMQESAVPKVIELKVIANEKHVRIAAS